MAVLAEVTEVPEVRVAPGWSLRLAMVLVLALSSRLAAQPALPRTPLSRGTTISGCAGVATAASEGGILAGGAVGWEIGPRYGLEARAVWLNRPDNAEAFSAALGAHVNLRDRRTVVPFVKGGVALYRASFDLQPDALPTFYRRRFDVDIRSSDPPYTFTDPAFTVGGGVNVFMSRHVAIRPEVEAIIVRRQSRSYVVTALMVHLAYHFEEHPVTPARNRK